MGTDNADSGVDCLLDVGSTAGQNLTHLRVASPGQNTYTAMGRPSTTSGQGTGTNTGLYRQGSLTLVGVYSPSLQVRDDGGGSAAANYEAARQEIIQAAQKSLTTVQ